MTGVSCQLWLPLYTKNATQNTVNGEGSSLAFLGLLLIFSEQKQTNAFFFQEGRALIISCSVEHTFTKLLQFQWARFVARVNIVLSDVFCILLVYNR